MHNYFRKHNGTIYVIAGKLKGRKISFNNTFNLRPTTNQIRETLFQWLYQHIKNAQCLDCFSGSGALGIEAISRYAKFVTFLEIEKTTSINLKKNTKKLNIHNAEVIHTNTLNWLKQKGKPYDIIFIDPPYYQGLVESTLYLLEHNQWIKNNSWIYIEKEKHKFFIAPSNWILHKKKLQNILNAIFIVIIHLIYNIYINT